MEEQYSHFPTDDKVVCQTTQKNLQIIKQATFREVVRYKINTQKYNSHTPITRICGKSVNPNLQPHKISELTIGIQWKIDIYEENA